MGRLIALAGACVVAGMAGCGVRRETLMVTPAVYLEGGLDPFAHVDAAHRTPDVHVFYATNRARRGEGNPARYGNRTTASLQVGEAVVRLGEDHEWEELHRASRIDPREREIILDLVSAEQRGSLEPAGGPEDSGAVFFDAINNHLRIAKDPELLVYVHGAKVNFYNACVFAAELDHFTGRDLVSVAFAWPTHQNVFAYMIGEDVRRARESAHSLATLLRQLAARTNARRINIVCWSAGGRVVARALSELGREGFDPASLRIGAAVFAAPDVPVARFLELLPNIHAVAERVIVIASDDDFALQEASRLMGGGERLGSISAGLNETWVSALGPLGKVELIDVSYDRDERGFDIGGHRYWFRHGWVASDVVLALRTRLPAERRGLEPAHIRHVWYLPGEYEERVRRAAREALGPAW